MYIVRVLAVALEEEKLWFCPYVEDPAFFFNPGEDALENIAGVAIEGLSIWEVNIAEEPSTTPIRFTPGQNCVGVGVYYQTHITFLNAGEALYRGAIKPDAFTEGTLKVLEGDINALDSTGHICELE
jgi:hypothetical protein